MPAGGLPMNARGWGWAVAVGLAGAALLGLISWSVIDHAVHYDELLHILSARGLLQTGQLAIADGLYTRAELFTRAVAWSFQRFGESPVAARLPALAAGATLVCMVGIWVVRRAGLLAGISAVLLLCMVPTTVEVAVFARFYTLHTLVVTLVFIAVYEALQPRRTPLWRISCSAVAVSLLSVAWHLQ